jgi:hypothetical protein
MQPDSVILQTVPEHICDAFLSWTLCTYYADPIVVSVIVLAGAAVGIFLLVRKRKNAKKNFG